MTFSWAFQLFTIRYYLLSLISYLLSNVSIFAFELFVEWSQLSPWIRGVCEKCE